MNIEYTFCGSRRKVEWHITPPRPRSLLCRDGLVRFRFTWLAWGRITDEFESFGTVVSSDEIITPTSKSLHFLPFESTGHFICFGETEITEKSDIEEMFFNTEFPYSSSRLESELRVFRKGNLKLKGTIESASQMFIRTGIFSYTL